MCRGCRRYAYEVIRWNSYDSAAKAAVLKRIETLVCQILENRFGIASAAKLRQGLEQAQIPYDPNLSPFCWLHNLLKKHQGPIDDLNGFGVYPLPDYAGMPVAELSELIEREILALCNAHFERYLEPVASRESVNP